jgi:hypothetical protein
MITLRHCGSNNIILIDEFDAIQDRRFIDKVLERYLKDLFEDLSIRSQLKLNKKKRIDKGNFIDYC